MGLRPISILQGFNNKSNNNNIHINMYIYNMTGDKQNNYALSALFGAISGTIAKSSLAPLDRLKIIFQTSNIPFTWNNMYLHSRTIIQKEGGGYKLWKGNGVQIARIAPVASLSYTFQKYYRSLLSDADGKVSTANGYLVGLLTGISSTAIVYPLDTLRCRIATDISKSTTTNIIQQSVKNTGIRSLYNGFLVSSLGMMPYSTISWGTFYYVNNTLQSYKTSDTESHTFRAIAIYISACLGQTIVYPIDVWRRRIQNTNQLPNQMEILKNIIKERALFKGLSVNFVKTPIVNTLSFSLFSMLEQTFANNIHA
jgi:hypothetical protein